MHLDAALGHPHRRHRLDAQVERRDGEPLLSHGGHDVRLARRHLVGERRAGHLRRGPHHLDEPVDGALGGRAAEDAGAHGPALAQVPGEGAGVDAADADDVLCGELVAERAARAPGLDGRGEGSRTT
ncbi:hypothetical protein GCM10025868_03570 [Angustibacter aerolatus]|uniref:Uncharacterized protein n=1 Tax=Angustibacter aerolatus TaxID=1162965 RepID=A0ABQ6JA95_9ACTN|nr:hypothetical protein GCM10025868_03570 [Angustibacter aerolatus]